MKNIGSVKENLDAEKRISITPETTKKLIDLKFSVFLEKNYGKHLGILDEEYKKEGANILTAANEIFKKSDIILKTNCPFKEEINLIKDESILIGQFNQLSNKEIINKLIKKKIKIFSLDLLPRITRAQSMDTLSSQANLAGYRAVIEAAEQFGKAIPMMMTAAGTIIPAKILVIGAGVAGLQAIATAKRLGAIVSATDVRIATKEQVESLGAKFIMVEDEESQNAETSGGYAKEMSEEYKKKQSQLIAETISKQDIVICTALIPGKPAPVLVSEEMINTMAPGSIVVDLAVEAGGNCPLSKLGEIVIHNSVKIIGHANVPGRVAKDASALYAKNIVNFLSLFIKKDEKKIDIDWNDEIINAVVLTHNGVLKLEEFK